jgi:hypothetical protein
MARLVEAHRFSRATNSLTKDGASALMPGPGNRYQ